MRKPVFLFAMLLCCTLAAAGELPQPQTDRFAPLDSLLNVFYTSLEMEDVDEKNAQADFLIGTCRDSLTRQHVALSIFEHYRYSRVMGEEAVAIHVYDEWFKAGKVSFRGEFDEMDAEVFVRFNRSSLIGADAQAVTLFKPCGGTFTIPRPGHSALLFFYDTGCAKCKIEFQFLPQVLEKVDFDLDVFLVNSSANADKREWRRLRRSFKVQNRHLDIVHLWDPGRESGFEFAYGVIATPRIFVVEPGGTIIGRRLELENLPQMFGIAGAIQATYDKYR